jgi:DNA-binding response OmpR family regulator
VSHRARRGPGWAPHATVLPPARWRRHPGIAGNAGPGTDPATSPGVGKEPRRLLIVDDEAAIRFALSDYFRECGWEVDAAAEKEEAEALLAHTEYAAVIADLRLTGIYGIEGLDIIQWSRHLRPETRVVLLTGNGTPEIEAEARRRGADAFLHKPLPLPELERVVAGLTGGAA